MKYSIRILFGLIVVVGAGYFMLNEIFAPSTSVARREADVVVSASQLALDYAADEEKGNNKYLGKVLRVSGEILMIEGDSPLTVVLSGSDLSNVRVELQDVPDEMPEKGNMVIMQGVCSGVLLDVVLNNGAFVDE